MKGLKVPIHPTAWKICMFDQMQQQVSSRLSRTIPTTYEFNLLDSTPAWVKSEFVEITGFSLDEISLKYRVTSSLEEAFWNTRYEWKAELIEFLNSKLSQDSDDHLNIRGITISRGSLFFGIDVAILGGIAAILGIINGLVSLGKHIAEFFRNKINTKMLAR